MIDSICKCRNDSTVETTLDIFWSALVLYNVDAIIVFYACFHQPICIIIKYAG